MLITRAEEMLWPAAASGEFPGGMWSNRAVSNERWPWLPPKGLETLRSIAMGQGKWRYTEDGYIEKGPFPPPRTWVSVSQRDYNDATGEATIEIIARDAGNHGRVHYATNNQVSSASPRCRTRSGRPTRRRYGFSLLTRTTSTRPGEPVPWTNKLTLTHRAAHRCWGQADGRAECQTAWHDSLEHDSSQP